jgi:lipid-A-disaccharide synthase
LRRQIAPAFSCKALSPNPQQDAVVSSTMPGGRSLAVFVVAGEESGDQLGAALMRALRSKAPGPVRFTGVGGEAMRKQGLASLFPISDIALMGWAAVARSLPTVLTRLRGTVDAVIASDPDVLVIIDSPGFTQRLAKRVRRLRPHIPIVNYVSPSVWAWKAWRAPRMRDYVDHVLALLPFEPAAHERLGGPPCTYVGHPLAEQLANLRPNAGEEARRESEPHIVLVLPGSRRGEIRRLLDPFHEGLVKVQEQGHRLELVLPTLPHLEGETRAATAQWRLPVRIVSDPTEKLKAFRTARAALAASGTVTLELALAQVPTVAAYKVGAIEAAILRRMIKVPSVILANLVLGENVVPEFLQENCTPDNLATALTAILGDGPERSRQLEAFSRLEGIMATPTSPSDRAAAIVLEVIASAARTKARR